MEIDDTEMHISDDLTCEQFADAVRRELDQAEIPKWDLYLLEETIYGLYFRRLDYEMQTDAHNLTYFLRIFYEKSENDMGIGMVQSNSIRPEDIQNVIKNAIAIARVNTGPQYDLVTPGQTYPTPKTIDKEVWENPRGFLIEMGHKIRAALSETMYVEPTLGKFREYKNKKMVINSTGLDLTKISTDFCYEFSLKATKDGKLAEYWPKGYLKSVDHLRFDEYIPQWATIARDALRAEPPSREEHIDVVFPPIVVRSAILPTFGYSVSGEALYDNMTHFNEGDQVAVEDFTMLDDALLPDGLNTSAFDGEGNPKQTTKVIENGIMKQYLLDQKYATLLNSHSTGNGRRHDGVVGIELNNLVIEPGQQSIKELIGECQHGVYIDAFSWLHPDSITGVFGAEIRNGYMIENGEIGQPIKGGNISGNVYEMMKNVIGISKECHYFMNAKVPFMKFRDLTLSGD